jgi:DNA end-binding protein Ku
MARSIWSGSISFGLVNVPVKLYTAVRQKEVHFHMLTPDGKCRVRRKLYCPDTDEEVEYSETTRGYEVAPDQYVVVSDEELQALKPEASRTITITDFVELADIDPVFYERPYYLAPDERAGKSYHLLFRAMKETKRVALATFVMRQKQYLAAIRPAESILMLETMNYADEIVNPSEVPGVDDLPDVDQRELKMAKQLIDALAGKFQPDKYHDEYREAVMEMIEKKAQGKEVHIAPPAEEPARVINLMKALEASLAEARKSRKAPATRKKKSA